MEMHPGWRNDQMLQLCEKNEIHVTVSTNMILCSCLWTKIRYQFRQFQSLYLHYAI